MNLSPELLHEVLDRVGDVLGVGFLIASTQHHHHGDLPAHTHPDHLLIPSNDALGGYRAGAQWIPV